MKTSAYYRDTRHAVSIIRQSANGWFLTCVDRSAVPKILPGGRLQSVAMPEMFVPEDQFSQEEHDTITAAFALLERGFANVYDAHAADAPERTKEHVAKLVETKKDLARIHDAVAEKHKEHAALDALTEAKRREHDEIDAALAKKRAELEAASRQAEGVAALVIGEGGGGGEAAAPSAGEGSRSGTPSDGDTT